MRYAEELGVPLKGIMGWRGPLTDRQVRAWAARDAARWNELTKLDWYLMRIAQRAANAFGGNTSLEDQRVVFEEPRSGRRTEAELAKDMRDVSFARVGGRVRTWIDGELVYIDERAGDS